MRKSTLSLMFILALLASYFASAASTDGRAGLNAKLDEVRNQRLAVEKSLVEAGKNKRSTDEQLKRLRTLQKLQTQEKALTEQRLETLETYLKELHVRKEDVKRRIDAAKAELRTRFSKLVHPLLSQNEALLRGDVGEGESRIKEKVISSVALSQLKDLEGMFADLQDAEDIESRIEQEKQQISALMQDISEQQSLIEFHQKIRQDSSEDKHAEHLRQLEEYRKLKVSEVEIENRVAEFQDRQKLEHEEDKKKQSFISFKPKSLPWPLKGKVVDTYGQHKDGASGLNIFKKGIEILTLAEDAPVTAVLSGKVQFSGEIPGKGRVVIIEHPHAIYTIYGGMKEVSKAAGDELKAGQFLGKMESEQPLYFEIRARSVAIDPVKWLQ